MKNKFLLTVITVIASLSSISNFAQSINLGTAANFVIFTKTGAVGNTGTSQITGNVGTHNGGITGFGNVNGVMANSNGATAAAANDLQTAYGQLNNSIATFAHAPLLGNGEVLTAGVYNISGQTTLSNTLTLDAQNNPNAVFIFKVSAVFNSNASSQINLINGALACNVFWKVEGAVNLGTLSTMRGTIVANNGAIDLAPGITVEGRLLSTTGAVTVNGVTAKIPIGCGSATLTGPIAPNLGTTACYALFSRNGEVTNSASSITRVKGDVGTNVGLTTGYDPLLVEGTIHPIPDNSTAAASADLLNVRTYLEGLTPDIELLFPAELGKGLVLTPHTYIMNGAAFLTDTLVLNAEGNADGVFVLKVYGAFSTTTFATIKLINGTQAKNVYWLIGGAVSINNYANIKGTIVCHNGAINLKNGTILEGRAMTTDGALLTSAITANITAGCNSLPVSLVSFTGSMQKNNALLTWKTLSEQNTSQFEVEQGVNGKSFSKVGSVAAAGNSNDVRQYSFTVSKSFNAAGYVYYRLKIKDVDGKFVYSNIVALSVKTKATALSIYPNPVKENATLSITVTQKDYITYTVIDNSGKQLLNGKAALSAGLNSLPIAAKTFPRGSYTIKVSGSNIEERIQFIKQ